MAAPDDFDLSWFDGEIDAILAENGLPPDARVAHLALSAAIVRWGREAAGITPPFRKSRKAGGGDPDD